MDSPVDLSNWPTAPATPEAVGFRGYNPDLAAQIAPATVLLHTPDSPEYEVLAKVLRRAYNQAARGKGAQRHGQGQPFDQQPMQQLIALYGVGFALGQAGKKAQESQRMDKDAAVRELLGAINYLAGAVIALEK